jgi:hypothetical protein
VLAAVGSVSLLATPALAQETLSGQLFVAWGDGPEGPHIPYFVGADGGRTYVVLAPEAVAAAGGLGKLDRANVSVRGEFLSAPFADGAPAFMGGDMQVVQTAKLADGLASRAEAEGSLRVVVWLNASYQPEGTLAGAAAVAAQQAGIAAARASVLSGVRAGEFETIHEFDTLPLLAMQVTAAALADLEASPFVARVEADRLSAPSLAESVPLIGGNTAWSMGFTGDRHMVAILDTGVMKTHSFFGGRVHNEACRSSNGSNTVATWTSLCPGAVTASDAVGSGVNCTGMSGCDHGTHVAGIAAGAAYTGTGAVTFSGVGRAARIMAIQVFTRFVSTTYCGSATPCILSWGSDQLAALNRIYALRNTFKYASANMSLGGNLTSANCDADPLKPGVDLLRSVGIATVIAAGNNGSRTQISYPACISTAVSVGSTGDGSLGATADVVSSFSNAANIMHMWAPGQAINSSVITSTTAFANFQGTSMATPHVAGAWAILKEKRPYALGDEIRNSITSTGLVITDTRTSGTVAKPRIRIPNALNAISYSTPVVQLWYSVSGGTTILLWARVQNTGSVALPASDAVWFWVDGIGYVGATSVGGLAPGANAWYSFNWTIPPNISGVINYWGRVWDGAQGGFWTGAWAGPQAVDVGYPAPISQLWPPYDQTGSNTINRGDTTRLWAYVSNNRSAALPAAGVYFNVAPTGPFPMNWVGATAINPLTPGISAWRLFNWVVPAAHPVGPNQYHAQSWFFNGAWRAWSTFYGPQAFVVNP